MLEGVDLKGNRYRMISGKVSDDVRAQLIGEINDRTDWYREKHKAINIRFLSAYSEVVVLLAITPCIATGLDIVGATRVFMLDGQFNPAILQQLGSRVWRTNQIVPVYIYRLITNVRGQPSMVFSPGKLAAYRVFSFFLGVVRSFSLAR